MKQRYGEDYVCRVGTYTTLQLKGVIKDLSKSVGAADPATLNKVTKMVEEENNTKWEGLFIDGARKTQLKHFIVENSDVINDTRIALGSIKSSSQHACATIIVPKIKGKNIWSMIPLRKDDQGGLISEWEGEDLAKAGYLKEDILSTKQMAKINAIFDLIQQNHSIKLRLENIPLDDKVVYKYFCEGHTQDVFHFGSDGLTNYLKQLQPENIHDLIAAIALYRPGAMSMEAHTDYIERKNGIVPIEYDFGLEDVFKDTYGVMCYQEQVMRACQVLGGFNLVDADGVRKAMGKKIKELMDSYKSQFIEGALKRSCPEDQAHSIWDKLERFAAYGFNKSHAAAYAITGYICNWLKVNYPMEFWTIAFTKGKPEDLSSYIAEIEKTESIKVLPPDINSSNNHFVADFEKKVILWSIDKIRMCGPSATEAILHTREEGGKFFSLQEFMERTPSSMVKKPTIINLILSGAFDQMYYVTDISQRKQILKEFFELRKEEFPLEFQKINSTVYWELAQSELSKLGSISFRKALIESKSPMRNFMELYKDSEQFFDVDQCAEKSFVMVAGIVEEIRVRVDKFDRSYADIVINNNNTEILVRIFADIWMGIESGFDDWREQLEQSKGRILFITGIVSDWRNQRNLQTVSKSKRTSQFDIF